MTRMEMRRYAMLGQIRRSECWFVQEPNGYASRVRATHHSETAPELEQIKWRAHSNPANRRRLDRRSDVRQ
jgi:hypothetical protein